MKVKEYFDQRREYLVQEKMRLISIQKEYLSDLDVLEEHLKKEENKIDIGYELFSPKSKQNELGKEEIMHYKKRIEALEKQKSENEKLIQKILEELDQISQAEEELKFYVDKREIQTKNRRKR